MASTSSGGSRRERESDSMEVLKPLVVLGLFGMILYGAYSVVQKGPATPPTASSLAEAPPFAAPAVEIPSAPETSALPQTAGTHPSPTPTAPPSVAATTPPPDTDATYLPAESAPPPSADPVASVPRADEVTTPTPVTPPAPALSQPEAPLAGPPAALPTEPPDGLSGRTAAIAIPAPVSSGASSAAFTSAWADAHDKLAAGRYAEALAALSVWYDDPALGLEESQRLEDLLGQLAGTVIYSQQDLLLPPYVVAAGDTLPGIAGQLRVSPELLAKINGIDDPSRLVPGEHLKLVRGPFDAVVSVSRRRISLQLNGAYAGSFPVVVGRRFLDRVGASLPVIEMQRGPVDGTAIPAGTASARKAIILGEDLVIEASEDPISMADASPQASLVMSVRDLDEMLDILGPASRVLVRQ